MDVLVDYSFVTVAIGTMLLAGVSSIVGSVSVLTKQSLIGDTMGHASYPGVIFAFMMFQTRNPVVLMIGAMASGYLSYFVVRFMTTHSRHSLVNALAIVSSSFFGLGMVLKNFVQGHENYSNAAQAGLQRYLFGQAAFVQIEDIYLIACVSCVCLVLFIVLYPAYKLYLFDTSFAQVSGLSIQWLERLTMFMMMSLIAVGLKVVGAVLMSSFLIAPAVVGILLGKHYHQALILSAITGVSTAFVGTYASSVVSGLSTGPAIIVCMSLVVFASFLYSKGKHRLSRFEKKGE